MSEDDQSLPHRLRAHVTSLAEEIGERNVFNSEALRHAAAYIEAEWGALGYGVEPLEYDVSGIRCANLIATREGAHVATRFCYWACTMIQSVAVREPMTTPAALPRCWKYPECSRRLNRRLQSDLSRS